jgi:hypothetical protein
MAAVAEARVEIIAELKQAGGQDPEAFMVARTLARGRSMID